MMAQLGELFSAKQASEKGSPMSSSSWVDSPNQRLPTLL